MAFTTQPSVARRTGNRFEEIVDQIEAEADQRGITVEAEKNSHTDYRQPNGQGHSVTIYVRHPGTDESHELIEEMMESHGLSVEREYDGSETRHGLTVTHLG